MIFVTGADWRFKDIVKQWSKHLDEFNYEYRIYDLGNLGYGVKGHEVEDLNFINDGYYNSIRGKWKSTALWKPAAILDAMANTTDNIVYLDADSYVMKPLDIDFNFDVGVVERTPKPDKDPIKIMMRGNFNAGVLFFRNCPEVRALITEWKERIQETKNDQATLNMLLVRTSLKLKIYPYWYNTNLNNQETVIYHQAGAVKNGKVVRQTYY
jgi:hypothetical protein